MQEAMCSFYSHNQSNSIVGQSAQSIHYILMARDRVECRELQNQLEGCSSEERNLIFNSLYSHLSDLVCDSSANYVIQKLCEVINSEQQKLLLKFFLKNYQNIIKQPNGCRVLQKFIETTSKDNVEELFIALRSDLVELSFSLNGNHIVQRFIECLPNRGEEIVQILNHKYHNLWLIIVDVVLFKSYLGK